MRFFSLVLFTACSEYEIKAPAAENPPIEDTAVELMAPVAVAGSSMQTKRGQPVQLSGIDSYDPDDGAAQLAYQWAITESPDGSLPELDSFVSPLPLFSSDLLGTYVVELNVTDADGLVSQYPSATMIEVGPYEDLFVELTWDAAVDLDLHLVSPGGSYYGPGDCYFGNPTPDWGVQGDASDNPELVFDDEGLEMMERIELLRPEEGIYGIMVHHYNQRGAESPYVTPHIRVWAEGELRAEFDTPRLVYQGAVVTAGSIDWSSLTVTEDGSISDHAALGGPLYND